MNAARPRGLSVARSAVATLADAFKLELKALAFSDPILKVVHETFVTHLAWSPDVVKGLASRVEATPGPTVASSHTD
jgi:hypothetical protein